MISQPWLQQALALLEANRQFVLATVVTPTSHPFAGSHILASPDNHISSDANLWFANTEEWSAAIQSVYAAQSARLETFKLGAEEAAEDAASAGVFLTYCGPPPEAWIFGAGHIASALTPVLVSLGWRVIVCDDRSEFVSIDRFPGAAELRPGSFEQSAKACAHRAGTWVVLVTRGHQHDVEILKTIAQAPGALIPRYLGMIGSKRRVGAVRKQLEAQGFTTEFLDALHAPIGLPIGADTPAEIAISIASEMVAIRRGRRWDESSQSLKRLGVESRCSADTAGRLELWRGAASTVAAGNRVVLATIIDRRGSTPRGPGAQMVVFGNGSSKGTIGGGCGEGIVLRAARKMLLSLEKLRLLEIDLTGHDASEASDICGGHYSVFLEALG